MQEPAPDLNREFRYSIDIHSALPAAMQESNLRRQVEEAFPELIWSDGEGNFGKIFLAGESLGTARTPSKVALSLLCKEPPGPFQLTIRLRNAGLLKAEELKNRLLQAIPGAFLSKDFFPDPDVIPWVNTPPPKRPATPDLPSVNPVPRSSIVDLKIPVQRPIVAIFESGLEILLSRPLLEAMAARIEEIKKPMNQWTEDERLEKLRGARARDLLAAASLTGIDGNSQLPRTQLPSEASYLLAHLLERGLAEIVHFNSHGMALAATKIHVHHFEMRAGPTAGFGGVRFSIWPFREILCLNTWVS
jgi:hypothetical protein